MSVQCTCVCLSVSLSLSFIYAHKALLCYIYLCVLISQFVSCVSPYNALALMARTIQIILSILWTVVILDTSV